jgi:hypothetical protein
MGVGGEHHAPATLPPGKTRYALYRRLGGPQDQSGGVRKTLLTPGFDSWSVQVSLSLIVSGLFFKIAVRNGRGHW